MPGSENRKIEVEKAYSFFRERFGVEVGQMDGFRLERISGDFWLVSDNDQDLEAETRGLRALRDTGKYLKPTTYVLQLFDDELEKNVVELEKDELKAVLEEEDMIEAEASSKGYVAIKYEGRVIGCGLYKDDVVSSRVSRGRAGELSDLL